MKTEEIADEVIESDVLVIGGGLAGCMAAIRAREHGLDTVVIEKAAINRSGECGRGIDHYVIAHPLINGIDPEEYGRWRATGLGGLASTELSVITTTEACKPLARVEDMGVKIREEAGQIVLSPGRWGGFYRTRTKKEEEAIAQGGDFVFYRGADLKLKLAKEVHRVGARVFDRTMLTNFIKNDGSILGAMAVNVRNGKFLVFKAKATILATAGSHRMYSYQFAPFPSNLFTTWFTPTNAGGGIAAAYRAGAELTNMEYCYVYVQGGGLGWGMFGQVGAKLLNSKGEELYNKYPGIKGGGEEQGGLYQHSVAVYKPNILEAEIEKDICWFDTTRMPEEFEYCSYRMYANESPKYLGAMRERGGIRRAPFEARLWLTGIPRSFAGVIFDDDGRSSLRGLFVAGDCQGGVPLLATPGAFVWGLRCADSAAKYSSGLGKTVLGKEQLRQIREERNRVLRPVQLRESENPADCVDPLELEDLVRTFMWNYVGITKVEPRLNRVLQLLNELKARFVPVLKANNPHELMRALEVQDIIDICEVHAAAARLRTETRLPPDHYRWDYPAKGDDTYWAKNIIVKNVGGEMEHELRKRD